jgi:hypothetical protein
MARNIKRFVNEGFFQTVDLDLLDRLLESYADRLPFKLSDLPKEQEPRRKALYEHFLEIDETFPPQLLDALHCIVQLSDLRGLQLLRERAELAEVLLVPVEETEGESDGRHLHPQHVALRAYLDHREVFDRTIVALAFFQASSPMEFNGAREGIESRHDDPEACEAFRDAVSAYFRQRYLGRHCPVFWYPEDDEINILIRHGRNMVVLMVEEHGDERVASIREVRQDTIRYRPATGRLKVSAEQPIERKQLSRLFAEHLLGEADFFDWSDSQNLYTLQPVRDQGIDFELKTGWDDDLKKVRIAEIQVMEEEEEGGGRRRRSPWVLTVRDPRNAIKQLKRLLPWINFGTIGINYLKLEFKFWLHGKYRYIMVKIKPKDVVSFRQHVYEDRIMEHLRRNGLCLPRPS